ncbi:flagellar basal-body rod protein FlgF [Litorimonas taeanensis]|uniref:Flagellar basal-body rod protein FlgF n=1 Tax=Litorimonas taeanensis TaxID=568099 RepID=A0A420WMC3_9PROT|nr:flagellar hook-basal body complex protein [Litorimonas taeanensis]RKQ72157.1 flagellar basal-body rod protein FlgF [Litorimonas taeanensis]
MGDFSYIAISRQSGLMKEMSLVANNMANSDTVGYKRQGAIFAEHIAAIGSTNQSGSPEHSLSMGHLAAHSPDFGAGSMRPTGGSLDIAIEGEGFFMVNVDGQTQLTRAGNFMTDAEGRLINVDGNAVLDSAEGEIQIPIDAGEIFIAEDGSISANGVELGRIGVATADPQTLSRQGNNNYVAREGFAPSEFTLVRQGYLEDSNVDPMTEISRMIEVQRYYDAGQKIFDMEDDRIKQVISTIRQIS